MCKLNCFDDSVNCDKAQKRGRIIPIFVFLNEKLNELRPFDRERGETSDRANEGVIKEMADSSLDTENKESAVLKNALLLCSITIRCILLCFCFVFPYIFDLFLPTIFVVKWLKIEQWSLTRTAIAKTNWRVFFIFVLFFCFWHSTFIAAY